MAIPTEGTCFGKYLIEKCLGSGAAGTVYLAEDTTLGRRIALKVLSRDLFDTPQFEQRFLNEARTVASLVHPRIVAIHSLEHVEDRLAIDMAYVPDGSLEQLLSRQRLPIQTLLGYVHDVLHALAFCHDRDIIHRDVKPSNILVSGGNRAFLTDFGLAKLLAVRQSQIMVRTSSSVIFMGTPRYAPPEAWDELEATPAWDLYSVGMVLYEALAPSLPYNAETPLSWVKQLTSRPIPPLRETVPGISPELSDLVVDMLAPTPCQRVQPASEALERLNRVPEMQGFDKSHVVTHMPNKRRAGSRVAPRASRGQGTWGRLGRVAGIGLVVLAVAALVVFSMTRVTHPSKPHTPWLPTASTGNGLLQAPLAFLSTQDVEPGQCFMRPDVSEGTFAAVVVGKRCLWYVRAKPNAASSWNLSGYWAAYEDSRGAGFSHGTLLGVGRSIDNGDHLAISLTLRDVLRGAEWTQSLLVDRPSPETSEDAPIEAIAGSELLPAIIFNELPARKVPWIVEVENEFFDRGWTNVQVAYLETTPIEAGQEQHHPVWERLSSSSLPSGQSKTSGETVPKLTLAYDVSGLLLAVRAPNAPSQMRIDVTLCPQIGLPLKDSPRASYRFNEHGQIISQSGIVGTGVAASWTVEVATLQEVWTGEIRIPWECLKERNLPGTETVFWLNCAIIDSGKPNRPWASWGARDANDILHGLQLHFQPPI